MPASAGRWRVPLRPDLDRADMLEATLPSFFVRGDQHFRMSFTLSSVELVGPCCAELADQQPP